MKKRFTISLKHFVTLLAMLISKHSSSQAVTAGFTHTLGSAGSLSLTEASTSTAAAICNTCALWTVYDRAYNVPEYNGSTAVHTFTANGSYVVRLRSWDNNFNVDSTQSVITVTNMACMTTASVGFHSVSPTNWFATFWNLGNITQAEWNWGDNTPNTSGINVSHTFSASGTYSVCLSFTNSCGSNTTMCFNQFFAKGTEGAMQTLTVVSTNSAQPALSTTGIQQLSMEKRFEFYPNPANETLTVNFVGVSDQTNVVKIYNALGELVYGNTLNTSKEEIDLSELPKGLYIIEFNERVKKKLMVQ